MIKFDLKNKTAIITGGAQGFGFEIAKKFLQSGSKVFIWDIDEKELSKAAKQINNPNLNYNVVDISNYDQIQKTVADIILNTVNGLVTLSARPSDAIALALRSNIPVTVNQDVFETNSIDLIIDNSNEIEEFKEFIKDIKPEDFS